MEVKNVWGKDEEANPVNMAPCLSITTADTTSSHGQEGVDISSSSEVSDSDRFRATSSVPSQASTAWHDSPTRVPACSPSSA